MAEASTIGPPASDQIEVCVFGPNYGECIVIHLGAGHWIVIDSCLYGPPADRRPVALAYLQTIGIDPAKAIKAVIATHWHDDHCRGLSEILSVADKAEISISNALTKAEFLRFSKRMGMNRTAIAGTKLTEFDTIIERMAARKRAGRVDFHLVASRTTLYTVNSVRSGHGENCSVIAMSPSQGDIFEFIERISQLMPKERETKRSISGSSPNESCVVLLNDIGPISIILGSDLENSSKPGAGWIGILASSQARAFGTEGQKASVFKVPHHGSETAHNPDVWRELLTTGCFAVVTPWRRGRGRLPARENVRDILNLTENGYCTATDARMQRSRKSRPPGVLRHLRESGVRIRRLTAPFGAVRLRMQPPLTGQWSVELFGSAAALKSYGRTKPVP